MNTLRLYLMVFLETENSRLIADLEYQENKYNTVKWLKWRKMAEAEEKANERMRREKILSRFFSF